MTRFLKPGIVMASGIVVSTIALSGSTQAATCKFGFVYDGTYRGHISATGIANKMKKACAHAKKTCNDKLARKRRKGKIPSRQIQCVRM